MTKSNDNFSSQPLNCQTWVLRVSIHCEGCKKKVFKLLQGIHGVYTIEIDSQQHKAIVTGNVDGETLVNNLLKSGKHAHLLQQTPVDSVAAINNGTTVKSKKNKKKKDNLTVAADVDNVVAGKVAPVAQAGGGGKRKKKKELGDGNNTPGYNDGAVADTGSVPVPSERMNLSPSRYRTVYNQPPHESYYPTPVYGMSYNNTTWYPSNESSYYAPPVYGYAQSHPSAYPAPPLSHPMSAFDDVDDGDYDDDGRTCSIM